MLEVCGWKMECRVWQYGSMCMYQTTMVKRIYSESLHSYMCSAHTIDDVYGSAVDFV